MLLQVALFPSFSWLSSILLCVCACVCVCVYAHIFLIHSSVDGHLGCFYLLDIVNSAAMNRRACGSFWIIVLSSYALRGEVAGSYSSSIFGFLRNLCTVLHRGCTDSHSHQSHQRLPFQQKYFLCISKFNCKSNLSTLLHRQKSRFLQRTTSHGIFSREVLRQKFCSHCTRSREESMSHNYFSLEPETAKICKRGEILLESKTGKKKKRVHFQKSRTSNNATLKHCKTVTNRATAHPLANGTLFFRKGFGGRPKTVTVRTQPWAVNVRRPHKPKCL